MKIFLEQKFKINLTTFPIIEIKLFITINQ